MLMNGREPGVIAIGIHSGLPYYDCGEGFVAAVQAIVDGYSAGSLKIGAPFLEWDKPTIWAFCKKHKIPIHLTYSCEKGGRAPCGKCLSCKDREALNVL
jgi:7-cyano-7-deazaguanine synthase